MKKSTQQSLPYLRGLAAMAIMLATNCAIAANLDTRLVGHWRNTIHHPSINYAQDSHYKLFEDGSFQLHVKGISNGRKFTEGPFYGMWSADGSVLRFSFNGGEQGVNRYQTDASTLLLIDQTEYRFWTRMR